MLWGPERSKQSICIKMGKNLGESMMMKLINESPDCNLEECGLMYISDGQLKGAKKDFDLIWIKADIVYYRECKGNMDLDTEKLPATINKVLTLKESLKKKYPGKTIDAGIFNWSLYDRSERGEVKHRSRIEQCESKGVDVDHFADFLKILNLNWTRTDLYEYFRELGNILNKSTLPETKKILLRCLREYPELKDDPELCAEFNSS